MTAEPKPGPAEPHAVHRAHAVQDRDKTAGIVSRGIAAFLDLLIVWMILGACYAGLSLLKFALTVSEFHFLHVDILFTTTGFVVTSVLYLAACWGVSGRTPGSVVMGLRVVDSTGGRVRPLVAVLGGALHGLRDRAGLGRGRPPTPFGRRHPPAHPRRLLPLTARPASATTAPAGDTVGEWVNGSD